MNRPICVAAIADYTEASQLDPKHAEAYNNRGVDYGNNGKYDNNCSVTWDGSSQLSRRIAMLLDENFCIEPKASTAWRYRALGMLVILGAAASLLTLQPRRSTGDEGPANAPVASKADSGQARLVGGTINSSTKPAEPAPTSGIEAPPPVPADKQDVQRTSGEPATFPSAASGSGQGHSEKSFRDIAIDDLLRPYVQEIEGSVYLSESQQKAMRGIFESRVAAQFDERPLAPTTKTGAAFRALFEARKSWDSGAIAKAQKAYDVAWAPQREAFWKSEEKLDDVLTPEQKQKVMADRASKWTALLVGPVQLSGEQQEKAKAICGEISKGGYDALEQRLPSEIAGILAPEQLRAIFKYRATGDVDFEKIEVTLTNEQLNSLRATIDALASAPGLEKDWPTFAARRARLADKIYGLLTPEQKKGLFAWSTFNSDFRRPTWGKRLTGPGTTATIQFGHVQEKDRLPEGESGPVRAPTSSLPSTPASDNPSESPPMSSIPIPGVQAPKLAPGPFYVLPDEPSAANPTRQVPPLIPDEPEQTQANGRASSKPDSTNAKAVGGAVESSAKPAQPAPKIGTDGALPAPADKPDSQRTIEDLTNSIRLDPKNAGAYYARGDAYYKKRDMARAISDFSEAIRLRPKDASAYFGRGNAYGGRHEFGLAIEDFTQAIQLGLANSDSYANRGGAYASINRSKEAFADFNEAIRQDPKFAYAYLGRGASRMAAGDFDKAIVDLTESIRLDPNYGYSYYYRALTYLKRGDKSKAEEDFTRAKNLGVDAPRPVELSTQPSIPGELAAFALPAYSMISQEDFRKSLQVSPQQVRELQDISKAIAQQRQERLDRSGKESANVPIERRDAWLSQKYKELDQELAIACGKRVERVLTSHQIDIYKTWVLPLRVYPMLHDPEIRKVLAISHDQDQFLARIEGEWGKQAGDQEIEYHDRLLALLNRQQREKLSVRMESGRFTARDDVQNQTKDLELPLGPFAELAKPTVRARVGFSLDQQNQIKQISAAYSKDRPEYADRLRKNSLEYKEALERRSAEGPATGPRLRGPDEIQEDNKDIFAKLLRKEGEAVQKIDALLTTEQRTKLKEIDFGNQAAIAVFDHSIAAEIGVTQQQEARRDQMASQFQQSQASLGRVAALKAYALLSPAQQSTLRDECDRRASW